MEEEVGTEIQGARLKGHYDLLLEMDSGERIVIDIKTTSAPRAYLPKEMHLRQLMAYQGMLGGIRGALLYVNRDTWDMSYVPQQFDKTMYSRLLVKLSTLYTAEQHKTLPPPQPEFDFECISTAYKCPFYDYCFPDIEQSNRDNS
jgi:RecB family exonuclease